MPSAGPPGQNRGIWGTERRTRFLTSTLAAAATVLAGYFALFRAGGSLVNLSYDLPFIAHRAGAAGDIRIVYLDELDGPVLNRRVQAELLDKLGQAGARAVIYDVIFDQPSTDPAVDLKFSEAMLRFRGKDAGGNPIAGLRQRAVMLACGRELIGQTGAMGERLIPPTDQLLMAADDFGLVLFVHDERFTVRELHSGSQDEPSLAWKAAHALGAPLEEANRLDPRWLNYSGPPPDPNDPTAVPAVLSCSARDAMAGADPAFFRDKIIVIGGKPGIVGAAAGQDLFATPFHRFDPRGNLPLMSGVELQAHALANFLARNWLIRSSRSFDLSMIMAAGVLAGFGFSRIRPIHGIWIAVAAALGLIFSGILSVHFQEFWFPWSVTAFLQIPVALVLGIASHFYIERFFRLKLTAEQSRLRDAFSKYLSPQMLDRLTAENFRMKVGGEKVMAAMMFTDIESFTDMCQRVRDPARIVELLNDYFHRTTGHIFDHDGIIIKFIGDAIFAAWGVPIPDPQSPINAVRAAWKLFISAKLVVDGDELRTRIGLNYGEVVAGNIGSDRHVDYTLIGDAVNLSARLESLNKMFDTNILLSDSIQPFVGGEFHTRRIGKFKVKGRTDVTNIYELIGPGGETPLPEWVVLYHRALAMLEGGDATQAHALFTATNAIRPSRGDGPSRFFLDLLNEGKHLPDGVVEMKEK